MKNTITLILIIFSINLLAQNFEPGGWLVALKDINNINETGQYLIPFNYSNEIGAEMTYESNLDNLPDYFSSQYEIVKTDGGYYYIINTRNNLFLTPKENKLTVGTRITQERPTASDFQQWKFVHLGNGFYYILPKNNDKLYLSISGAEVILSEFDKQKAQIWSSLVLCPFVYIKQDNQYIKQGEIIKNQNSKQFDRYDYLEIPFEMIENNILTIKISEEKDEISYLDHIYLQVGEQIIMPECNTNILKKIQSNNNEYYQLQKGEYFELTFNLPNNIDKSIKIQLVAKGYYELFNYVQNR